MLMTHVDLIEKLLKYASPLDSIIVLSLSLRCASADPSLDITQRNEMQRNKLWVRGLLQNITGVIGKEILVVT